MTSLSGGYNIAYCLVPSYLPSMPYDPSTKGVYYWTSTESYNTGYTVSQDDEMGKVTLSAPAGELQTVSVTR